MKGEPQASDTEQPAPAPAPEAERRLRADAQRNYERLVTAARTVFAREGGTASMEAIAKEAGVGIGTLYRRFPKRIDIVEAVYTDDVDQVLLTAEKAVANEEPWDALASWLRAFIAYTKSKRVLMNELQEAFEKNPELKVAARDKLNAALDLVLIGAQEAGVARTDISTDDLMELIRPMCMSSTVTAEQRERLLTMILDGLRTAPPR